jgi:hypothetical protein
MGRPREITPDDWIKVETMATCFCPLSEIAEAIKFNVKYLAKQIKKKYEIESQEFLTLKQGSGRANFRFKMYQMACDGKHPIVSIFCAKNWLGMIDEKTPPKPPDNSDVTTKFLTSLTTILNKITDKSSNLPKLEAENKAIEDAIYTEVPTDNNVPTSIPNNIIQLPTKHSIIEHSSIIEQDNNIVR